MNLHHLPNIISVVRIFLVVPVVLYILNGDYLHALTIFVIAGISDGVDGFLAKRFGWQSRLGSILDPMADKLLIVSTYAAVAWVGLVPWWLWATVLTRDVIIVCGGLAYHYFIGKFEMAPSLISKLNTVMQIALLVGVLSQQLTQIPSWLLQGLVFTALLTVLLSGLDYVTVWGKKAMYSYKKAHSK